MPGFDVELAEPGGQTRVRVSQSFVNSWRKCPRSAVAAANTPDYGSAAIAGIVTHAVMEQRVKSGQLWDVDEANDEAAIKDSLAEFSAVEQRIIDEATVMLREKNMIALTADTLRAHLGRDGVEEVEAEAHAQIVLSDTPELLVTMTCSADLKYRDPSGHKVLVDWKTGARMPEPWKIKRYGVQAFAYLAAFHADVMRFEYPVALASGEYTAKRFGGAVDVWCVGDEPTQYTEFLRLEVLPIAELLISHYRAGTPIPINPNDWHCSAKWCPLFRAGECIGSLTATRWVAESHENYRKLL